MAELTAEVIDHKGPKGEILQRLVLPDKPVLGSWALATHTWSDDRGAVALPHGKQVQICFYDDVVFVGDLASSSISSVYTEPWPQLTPVPIDQIGS